MESFFDSNLFFEYQPVFCSKTSDLVILEALVRKESEIGSRFPKEVTGFLSDKNVVNSFTLFTLERVFSDLSQSKYFLETDVCVSINLSKEQVSQLQVDEVVEALIRFNIEPTRIIIELSESGFFNVPEIISKLNILRKLGIKVAIDDYGSEFAGILTLATVPFDVLKIDISLTKALGNPWSNSLVRSLVDLCQGSKKEVIFEGVENENDLNNTTQCGKILLQGFLLGHPQVISSFDDLNYLTPMRYTS